MRQVRRGTFETNSSSTHSLTICTEEQFDKWKRGELLFDRWNDCFADAVTLSEEDKEDAKNYYNSTKGSYWKDWEQLSKEEVESWYVKYCNKYLRKNDYNDLQTYEEWVDDYNLTTFSERYTSPSGDKLVAFGKYGYDG